jgi:hypothetical protein
MTTNGPLNTLPTFQQRKRPTIRLNWQLVGQGPGQGETAHISFLKQGFFLAIRDDEGHTMALTFVPRPKFREVNGRTIVEAEGSEGPESHDIHDSHDETTSEDGVS